MRLSTRARYGLTAMIALAKHYHTQTPIALRLIAKKEGLPLPYLEQLVNKLRRQGLVKSVRGAQGGFLLSVDPAHTTAADVVKALEGSLAPVFCLDPQVRQKKQCDRIRKCSTRNLWRKLEEKIDEVLSNTTLSDLCQ